MQTKSNIFQARGSHGVFNGFENALMTDASERFSTREAEKFPFPGRERRDAKRRRPGDVDYDPRTLYLPAEFAKSLTVTASHQSLGNQGLERIFGVCVVDITTSRIILGQFGDDAECSSLRCLLYELRAVEIVKPAKMLSTETERVMVRHTRNPLVNELASLSEFWDAKKTVQEVKTIYKHIGDLLASGPLNKTDKTDLDTTNLNVGEYRPSYLPNILSEFYESLALSALGGALYYLKQTFLDETLLRFAKFDSLPCSDFCEVKIFQASLPILKHFKSAFDWAEANNSGRIIPHEGVHVEYDSACEKVKEVESSLARHLKEQQKLLGDTSITYVTVGKEAYVLEVPEHLRGSIPQDYELRSSKKGFYRYWTPSIKKFLGELSQVESDKESALKSILQRSDSLGKGAFVPNDISIGGSGCAGFILLSGPNIGGKSTLLRRIGVDAPAESFELSPVNRIFVRMGAKDHIMAVQSTFLTELSETALVLVSFLGNFEAFLLIERVTVPMTVPVYRRG
ncbi:hypothetical protein D5086_005630 [Populus alba]|uniref:Uncharacterized protein n=1 Tax=Populus alba TaxID=43335 RepID=A0ACC4CTU2_POPAL